MKGAVKKLFALILSSITAAGACTCLAACSSGGGDSGGKSFGKWDGYDGVKIGFADEETYNEGDIDESKILPELNCKFGEKYFMVIDFDIQADRNNDGRETVTADLKIQPAEAVAATIDDTNSGNTSEETNGGIREIKATYKIPETTDSVRNMRLVIQIEAKAGGNVNVELSFTSSGNIQGVKTEEIKKSAVFGYTENLIYAVSVASNVKGEAVVDGIKDKSVKEIVIPNYHDGHYVSAVSEEAFKGLQSLESVTIPDGVKVIGANAFSGCVNLKKANIPDSVTRIGKNAFQKCNNFIQNESGVWYIGKWVLGCDSTVKQAVLKDDAEIISEGAFSNYGIESVVMSRGLTRIDKYAFNSCTSLKNIYIPDGVTSVGEDAFSGCSQLESVKLPEDLSVIEKGAFSGCKNLKSIDIPKGVTAIEDGAFSESGLESVTFADGVTSIGESAFYKCESLTGVTLPDSVKSIATLAFSECTSLKSIFIPKSVETIKAQAFLGCGSVTIKCEVIIKPMGWDFDWNLKKSGLFSTYCSVRWAQNRE